MVNCLAETPRPNKKSRICCSAYWRVILLSMQACLSPLLVWWLSRGRMTSCSTSPLWQGAQHHIE